MTKEILINKIKELRIGGDSKISLKSGDKKYEFVVYKILDQEYIAFGGYGLGLGLYNFVKGLHTPEKIASEFERAIKGIDLTLNDIVFQ
jgi:hypothetical protein